jgi:hypothetical protein
MPCMRALIFAFISACHTEHRGKGAGGRVRTVELAMRDLGFTRTSFLLASLQALYLTAVGSWADLAIDLRAVEPKGREKCAFKKP